MRRSGRVAVTMNSAHLGGPAEAALVKFAPGIRMIHAAFQNVGLHEGPAVA